MFKTRHTFPDQRVMENLSGILSLPLFLTATKALMAKESKVVEQNAISLWRKKRENERVAQKWTFEGEGGRLAMPKVHCSSIVSSF